MQAWDMLAGRGVDLFTSNLPTEAFEWWQQRRELKLLQLKLMKQKQAQRRRVMPAAPIVPSSPPLSPTSSSASPPQPHQALSPIHEGKERLFDDPFGAMTPPDGSVILLSNSNLASATECLRPCCAPDRFRSSATAGDLILSMHTSPVTYFGNFNTGGAADAASHRRGPASSGGASSSWNNADFGTPVGQKLKPMPKFRRPWKEGSTASLLQPSSAHPGPALRSANGNLVSAAGRTSSE